MPASTATRAFTDGGSTLSRYAWSCSSNHSTRRHRHHPGRHARRPAAARARSTASCTSEPVPIRIDLRRGAALGLEQHVTALGRVLVGRVGRHALAGQRQAVRGARAVRLGPALEDLAPGDGGLVGVGRADDVQARDGAQRGQVLDRLVGRAVLAQADGVVRPHVRHRQVHQRGQPDGVAHVVGEHQEGAAVDTGVAVQRDAVHLGGHGVLADAEVDRAAVRVGARQRVALGQERRGLVDRGVVGARQVGGAAPQLGDDRAERLQHLAGGGAGGDAPCRPRRPAGAPPSPRAARPRRSGRTPRRARGWRCARRRTPSPTRPCASRPRSSAARVCASTSSATSKCCSGSKPRTRLVAATSSVAQRRAVRGLGVLGVRGRPGDDRAGRDERRAPGLGLAPPPAPRTAPAGPGRRSAFGCDALDVPAVRLVALEGVLGDRGLGVALDGDVVVVPQQRRGCRASGGRPARRPRRRCPPAGSRHRRWPRWCGRTGEVPAAASGSNRPRS